MKTTILVIIVSLIVSVITYGVTASYIKKQNYFIELEKTAVLLEALDQNKTEKVKFILANEIGQFYYNLEKSDDQKEYAVACNFFNQEIFQIVDKYMGDSENMGTNENMHNLEETLAIRKSGKERLEAICQKYKK